MKFIPVVLLALTTLAPALGAQGRASAIPGPAPSLLWAAAATPADTAPARRGSYWVEGAVAGGIVGAIAGGMLTATLCGLSETEGSCDAPKVVGGALVVGGAGAVVGGLIGALFPKH